MINASELRTGNLIFLDIGLASLDIHAIKGQDIADIENGRIKTRILTGIPLTPEILEACGFVDGAGNGWGFRLTVFENMEIVWYVQDGYIRYQSKGSGFTHSFTHIKHLHSLQNLFFILTNTELQISLPLKTS